MKRKNVFLGSILGSALLLGGLVYAQRPGDDINRHRHPNLAAAQRLCEQAIQRVDQAQHANEFDMSGHAQKAKDLLAEASRELKEAAVAANEHK